MTDKEDKWNTMTFDKSKVLQAFWGMGVDDDTITRISLSVERYWGLDDASPKKGGFSKTEHTLWKREE